MAEVNITTEQIGVERIVVLEGQVRSLVDEVSLQRAINVALTNRVAELEETLKQQAEDGCPDSPEVEIHTHPEVES